MSITVLDDFTNAWEPSAEDVVQYAEFLGIDVTKEMHLIWIAREGLCAPVPHPWKACTENGKELFYFNFETGESVWHHPCDERYRKMVQKNRKNSDVTGTDEAKTSPEKPAAPRFLPSPTMAVMLDDMWCGGIEDDPSSFAEIQSQVVAKCDVSPHLCCVPHVYPGFENELLHHLDPTQKDIDAAWLDAAIDVLGRPAFRPRSDDDFRGYSFAQDVFRFHADVEYVELTQRDGQRISSMGRDDPLESPPTSVSDIDGYDVGDVSRRSLNLFANVETSYERALDDGEVL